MYHLEKQWGEADAQAKRERDSTERLKLRQTYFAHGLVWLHARILRLRQRVFP